ncbi:MAG: amidohydrolase family protein [Phycisphaerae bacterium]|jgi:L-fuconolactonase|nr:amidohydrolase family protein [Phycisphaerae bacterium]
MPDFPIVDTHVHLWDTSKLNYPWLSGIPALNRSFLLDDYNAAAELVDVEAMVFMQCDAEPEQSLQEAEWVAGLAKSDPRIRTIISAAPLEDGQKCRPLLEDLASIPRVKGIRRLIQGEPDPEFCIKPDFLAAVRMLADLGLSFDICVSHPQMAAAVEMVRLCPGVAFILDHIGKPDIKGRLFEPWGAEIKALAELPDTYCKISGLITEADRENWTREDLRPYVEHVAACFGFDRVIFGGDWPVVTLAGEYSDWVDALDWALASCSAGELRKLFHDNALRIYKMED